MGRCMKKAEKHYSRRATQITVCRRSAIRPLLNWTYVPYR